MTWKTGYAYCCAAVSVDIDRFTDSVLKRQWVRAFKKHDGSRPTVAELRAACAEMRERGYKVFPCCDHAGPDGYCVGVPSEGLHA